MSLQYSTTVRNAQLDALETAVGTSPVLRLWSATPPANCAAADSGTKVAEGTLPSDWLANASGGSKSKSGTWTLTGQSGAGTGTAAQSWRLYDSTGTTCHAQGTVTGTGGGGDMTLDNVNVANNQTVTVATWTLTAGNA